MKKTLVVFILLMLAVPAMATITVTASYSGAVSPYTVTVSYSADAGDTLAPRAYRLNITCDANGTIGTVIPTTTDYYVAPGTLTYSGADITNWGSQIANKTDTSFLYEACALYSVKDAVHKTPPPTSGVLMTFPLAVPTGTTTVSITGGVVREAPAVQGNIVLTGFTTVSPCVKTTAPFYSEWVALGAPSCWCFQRNCKGDANGKINGLYWVATPDLDCLRAGFNKTDAQLLAMPPCAAGSAGMPVIYPVCSDFDHIKSGLYRVSTTDLNILRTYINKKAVDVSVCDMDNYNFWTN